ncbi:MAG: hypothetical protein J3Q66DRAFT_349341 [Benniella sp.]|nr:MAG: hypothetical protein J3Q66DRAFT_349341 [Benniella sp.]
MDQNSYSGRYNGDQTPMQNMTQHGSQPDAHGQNYTHDDSEHYAQQGKHEHVVPIKAPRHKSCLGSTCGRVACCLCVLVVLGVIIFVIVVFAVFKKPTVEYLGIQSDPKFTLNQGAITLGIDFVLNLQVNNPNPIGIDVDSIVSTAYFPGYGPSIGGGNLSDVSFPSKSTRVIQFPITVIYDRRQDPSFEVIQTILKECGSGLFGATDGKISVTYDVKATTKIVGIPFTVDLKNQATSFDCPVNVKFPMRDRRNS